jgi:hypothetical protein
MAASQSQPINPYHAPASRELDAFIHHEVLKNGVTDQYPFYSTEEEAALQLMRLIERASGVKIVTGSSTVSNKPWFARYELDVGNPTEVLAEAFPLAVCRLVILVARRL